MRVLLAVTALLSLALAGCSGDSGDEPSPSGGVRPTSSLSSTMTTSAAPVPTSDTLHFLAAPDMAPLLPPNSAEVATPVGLGDFGPGDGGQVGALWRHPVKASTNVSGGEVRFWIEVKETLVENPGTPAQPQCTWRLTLSVGADVQPIVSCINEPLGPINPGTKELVYTLAFESPIELEANETVAVRLDRAAFSLSPNNAVDVLSGSADHDSRVTLRGLKEPAPA